MISFKKLTSKQNLILILLNFFIITSGLYIGCKKYSELNFSCSGYFQQREGNEYYMNTNYSFIFKSDGSAMISMDGIVINDNEKKYIINRTVYFTYQHYKDTLYTISKFKVSSGGRENLPERLFSKHFFSVDSSTKLIRVSQLEGISKAWLIGSGNSSAFMCLGS